MKRIGPFSAYRQLLRACVRNPIRQLMLDNLGLVEVVLLNRYAPGRFKKERFGWDLPGELRKARRLVITADRLSCRQYQEVIRAIFESARDYHAAPSFDRIESKTLPFAVKGVLAGKTWRYFIVHTEGAWKRRLPRGSELTHFGAQTTAEAVDDLMREIRQADAESDRALATLLLTRRSAEAGHPIPPGHDIEIRIDAKPPVTVPWEHTAELAPCRIDAEGFLDPFAFIGAGPGHGMPMTDPLALAMAEPPGTTYVPDTAAATLHNPKARPRYSEAARAVVGRMVLYPPYRSLQQLGEDRNPHALARKKSFFPPLGKRIWKAKKAVPFQAYIYKLGRRRIGFIRIADFIYEPGQADAERDAFAALVRRMEAKADALVIDLFNNPGGSLLQVYTLASMLSEKPLTVPRHQVTLDRHEVVGYAVLQSQMATITTEKKAAEYRAANAEALGGYPFTLREVAQFRCYAERLIAEFNAAAGCIKVLTEPLALLGIETVRPSELATLSKPLFVLVNELDFSGGDFFPAILQDSKAATIVGVATAGAGGYIMEMNYFNPFGIGGLSLTASLAVRANGDFIENKGVEPDVDLALTAKDLQGGYRDLRKTINKIVASRLG